MAYSTFLVLHSILRWLVVVFGVLAVGWALAGWLGRRPWRGIQDRLGLLYTVSLDLQLLIGLILYFVVSPITTGAFNNFGGAMSSTQTRFFLVEHTLIMLVAVILAHIGRARARRTEDDQAKHRASAIFLGLSFLLLLAGIPWPFLPFGRPLLRWG